MRLMIFVAVTIAAAQLYAQDTIRSSINYRTGTNSSEQDKRASKPSNIYFGLQANQLLRQLLGANGNSGNPFLLTYGFNNKQTGNGLALGLAFSNSKVSDKNLGLDRETKNNDFNVRIGYDKKINIGKRWLAGGGIDLLVLHSKSFTKTDQGSETTTTGNGWGLGPRGSLLFRLSEKVYLGTETSCYFQSTKNKTEIVFPGGGMPQKTDGKESTFELQVPTAIFLMLRF